MSLPGEQFLGQQMSVVKVDAIHETRRDAIKTLAQNFNDQLHSIYADHKAKNSSGDRALKNAALAFLTVGNDEETIDLARQQYFAADNMTDRVSALARLVVTEHPAREECLQDYYDRWKSDALVIDKWFTLQATSYRDAALSDVTKLLEHSAFTFKNPNRVRSLIAAFASANPRHFHTKTGEGYKFLSDAIISLNAINPQIAARLVSPLGQWRRYDEDRKKKMTDALKGILNTADISNDVYEMASKSLGDD